MGHLRMPSRPASVSGDADPRLCLGIEADLVRPRHSARRAVCLAHPDVGSGPPVGRLARLGATSLGTSRSGGGIFCIMQSLHWGLAVGGVKSKWGEAVTTRYGNTWLSLPPSWPSNHSLGRRGPAADSHPVGAASGRSPQSRRRREQWPSGSRTTTEPRMAKVTLRPSLRTYGGNFSMIPSTPSEPLHPGSCRHGNAQPGSTAIHRASGNRADQRDRALRKRRRRSPKRRS